MRQVGQGYLSRLKSPFTLTEKHQDISSEPSQEFPWPGTERVRDCQDAL